MERIKRYTVLKEREESVLENPKNCGLKFNKEKCIFGSSQVTFPGHKFSEYGIIDEEKIKAIYILEPAKNNKSLQHMFNYLS